MRFALDGIIRQYRNGKLREVRTSELVQTVFLHNGKLGIKKNKINIRYFILLGLIGDNAMTISFSAVKKAINNMLYVGFV